MSSFKFLCVFSVMAVSLGNVRAISSEEKQKIQAATMPELMACSAKFGVTMEDMKKAKESGTLSTLDPCLMACMFKQGELIDDKGLYDVEKAEKFTKDFLSDEADKKKAMEIFNNCKSVNESKVTDGEKGCERAALLFECFRPFKDMFAD